MSRWASRSAPREVTGSTARRDLGIAVVGVGRWGSNVLRDFCLSDNARVVAVCDIALQRREWVAARYPDLSCRSQAAELWSDDRIEAVAICTPAESHFLLASAALQAGRHVFVEKPLCMNRAEAELLVAEAARRSLTLMVGHQLLYHPAVGWLQGLLAEGRLGSPRRVVCTRHNAGESNETVGPWWSLAPHDLSVVLYLLGRRPLSLSVSQLTPADAPIGSQWAHACLLVEGGTAAHISCAVGVAQRQRRILVEGEKGAAVFDESDGGVVLELYRRDVHGVLRLVPQDTLSGRHTGHSSELSGAGPLSPLRLECQHFVHCCIDGQLPRSSGMEGLRVVELLEAGERSLRHKSTPRVGVLQGQTSTLHGHR